MTLSRIIARWTRWKAERRHRATTKRTMRYFPTVAENAEKIRQCREKHRRGAREAARANFATMTAALRGRG